ncbi:E3 ubiquitin-protein ligase RNF4 [Spatholobus suberectus]|nr:E3 ubiquitin-protein ligase RNF4 [Spatholobus suberectus]
MTDYYQSYTYVYRLITIQTNHKGTTSKQHKTQGNIEQQFKITNIMITQEDYLLQLAQKSSKPPKGTKLPRIGMTILPISYGYPQKLFVIRYENGIKVAIHMSMKANTGSATLSLFSSPPPHHKTLPAPFSLPIPPLFFNPAGKMSSRPVRSTRRRKTNLELDLNRDPPAENVREEEEGPSTQQQERQQTQVATIDVDAIDDDVVESSPRAFAQAKSNARRRVRRRTIVDVDLEDETRGDPPNQTIINGDLYINLESSSSSVCENAKKSPERPKEPVFNCPICMAPLVEEMSTRCGHIFCKSCIKAAVAAQGKCPTCRKKIWEGKSVLHFHPKDRKAKVLIEKQQPCEIKCPKISSKFGFFSNTSTPWKIAYVNLCFPSGHYSMLRNRVKCETMWNSDVFPNDVWFSLSAFMVPFIMYVMQRGRRGERRREKKKKKVVSLRDLTLKDPMVQEKVGI